MKPLQKADRLLTAMMDGFHLSRTSRSTTSTAPQRRLSDTEHATRALRRLSFSSNYSDSDSSERHVVLKKAKPARSPPLKQHSCASEACAALTLFNMPELLEIILDFLDTDSVLHLRRTSRTWNETIRLSPTLRLHHFVYPQWDRLAADFQLLDLKLPGLSIATGDDLEMGKWIHVSMSNAAARRICPTDTFGRRVRSRSIFEGMRGGLGRRRRKDSEDSWPAMAPTAEKEDGMLKYETLQVMRPPILGMQAYIVDPNPVAGPSKSTEEPAEPVACAKVHCEAGITLGFLAETTQSLLMDTKHSATPDGRTVLYKAIVSFTTPNGATRRRGTARTVTRLK